jgi:hypothetical protein
VLGWSRNYLPAPSYLSQCVLGWSRNYLTAPWYLSQCVLGWSRNYLPAPWYLSQCVLGWSRNYLPASWYLSEWVLGWSRNYLPAPWYLSQCVLGSCILLSIVCLFVPFLWTLSGLFFIELPLLIISLVSFLCIKLYLMFMYILGYFVLVFFRFLTKHNIDGVVVIVW